MLLPFSPSGTPLTIAATGTTGNAALPTRNQCSQMLVTNSNPASVGYFAWGTSAAVTATNSGTTRSLMLACGSSQVFTAPPDATWVAVIMPTGQTSDIQFCWGSGE